MTKEQLDFIVAMIAGQQTATVHLSLMFAEQAGVSKDLVAESFRQTAELLGQDVMNREIIVTVEPDSQRYQYIYNRAPEKY